MMLSCMQEPTLQGMVLGTAGAAEMTHLQVACRSMLDICVRSIRKADCGTVTASRQATCWHTASLSFSCIFNTKLCWNGQAVQSRVPIAHPGENAVCEAYACSLCRHKGAHMCQENNQRNLLCVAALACVSKCSCHLVSKHISEHALCVSCT